MRRLWFTVFVAGICALLTFSLPAQARITGVWVEPPQPTPEDTVVLHVEGIFSDGCWGVTSHLVTRDGSTITVDIDAGDAWQPGWACILIIVEYALTDTLGTLPAGSYTVDVREHHESLRDPETEYASFAFAVTGDTPLCLCPCHGDVGCDGVCDVIDVVDAVNVAFRGAAATVNPSCPYPSTDVSCDGVTNVLDVVRFVNVAFRGKDAAAEFCAPCAP
ncbi:MAG TPA: hypothetical protein VM118_14230 [Acidobacteriota bacterium]|nr:hypothetical protein [Acidobacteriota bacterium]